MWSYFVFFLYPTNTCNLSVEIMFVLVLLIFVLKHNTALDCHPVIVKLDKQIVHSLSRLFWFFSLLQEFLLHPWCSSCGLFSYFLWISYEILLQLHFVCISYAVLTQFSRSSYAVLMQFLKLHTFFEKLHTFFEKKVWSFQNCIRTA